MLHLFLFSVGETEGQRSWRIWPETKIPAAVLLSTFRHTESYDMAWVFLALSLEGDAAATDANSSLVGMVRRRQSAGGSHDVRGPPEGGMLVPPADHQQRIVYALSSRQ